MTDNKPKPTHLLAISLGVLCFVIDQAHKYWMLYVYKIQDKGYVKITEFFNLVMAWNKGVSYGLFAQDSDTGRYVLIGVSLCIILFLFIWLLKTHDQMSKIGFGLVVGSALSNVLDRIIHGAVADFFHFHAYDFNWYIFNLADVTIVIGAGLLLLGMWKQEKREKKA